MSLVQNIFHIFKNDHNRALDYKTLKTTAIALRKEGKTYKEILAQIPVSKSTLSVWLHGVHLAQYQIQIISEKKKRGQLRGAATRRRQGEENRAHTYREIQKLTELYRQEHSLFHIGMALYWAEGGKEKMYKSGSRWVFANTDPRMVRTMLAWLSKYFDIHKNDLTYEIYIHESHKDRAMEVKQYWANELNIDCTKLEKIRYKRHNVKTNYSALKPYFGIIRLTVPKSSYLVRAVEGWVQAIEYCGIV